MLFLIEHGRVEQLSELVVPFVKDGLVVAVAGTASRVAHNLLEEAVLHLYTLLHGFLALVNGLKIENSLFDRLLLERVM